MISALEPAVGPVEETQLEAAPVTFHVTDPAGAVAPEIPVTVAVYVIVPPRTGLEGSVFIAIVGVALATTTETAVVGANGEYVLSPLYVATAVYVPATGVLIWQVYKALFVPLTGPSEEVQLVAAPEIVHVSVPVGAGSSAEPVTSAVNEIG